MNDILILKNGKHVQLEWSFLILEYLEDYPGGLKALRKDIQLRQHEIKVNNTLCYAVLRANLDEPITYTEALKLLDLKGLKTILKFIEKNENELSEFKKKDQTYSKKTNKKKKH